jgi:hypothetical protein
VRTAPNDRGGRPFSGPFWESPDIFVAPDLDAAAAPLLPPSTGGLAKAGAPNTLYAHVWNLGKAPSFRVRVEFYWFNPSLGISRADANLIGAAWVDLANRFTIFPQWRSSEGPAGAYLSRGSHAIVRCPTTWVPTYENGGHECLVVRAFEPLLDPVAPDQFSPAADRHVAQRNISVVEPSSPASLDLALNLGWANSPGDAVVDVQLDPPLSMEWLKLWSGSRNPGFRAPTAEVTAGFLSPEPVGARVLSLAGVPQEARASLLRPKERFRRGCDPLRIPFHASVPELKVGEAQVLRVRQRVDGDVVGGYTVVLARR